VSDVELERRIVALLRAPVGVHQDVRDRIMYRVREAARTRAPRHRARALGARSTRHSVFGLLVAASIGAVAVLSSVPPRAITFDRSRHATPDDSLFGRLRDTLLLERLIHDGDHRYAFVVDGARWVPDRAVAPARSADRLPDLLRVASDSN
jgi:hypothetical protein